MEDLLTTLTTRDGRSNKRDLRFVGKEAYVTKAGLKKLPDKEPKEPKPRDLYKTSSPRKGKDGEVVGYDHKLIKYAVVNGEVTPQEYILEVID